MGFITHSTEKQKRKNRQWYYEHPGYHQTEYRKFQKWIWFQREQLATLNAQIHAMPEPRPEKVWTPEQKAAKAAYHREYRKRNPDKLNQLRNNYRARKAGAKGSFTEAQWIRRKGKYGNRCAGCGVHESEKPLERDHIKPLILGGSNYIANIQPLCRSCNAKKNKLLWINGRMKTAMSHIH
jgi:5-methylcytosine-specific restriction endonuclease McrA